MAVHTVDTLLLRFDTLRQECLMREEQEQPSPHLIIDEAADCKQGLVLASALALHEQGLLRIWVMSSAMPPQLLWDLQNQPHDLVDMGGLPYGLRMVTVACIQGAWREVSNAIVDGMREPSCSILLYLPTLRACEAYEHEIPEACSSVSLRTLPHHAGRQPVNCTVAAVQRRRNGAAPANTQ